jgi:hypothetical protein
MSRFSEAAAEAERFGFVDSAPRGSLSSPFKVRSSPG